MSPFDGIPDGTGVHIDKDSQMAAETGWYSPAFYEAFYSFYSFYGFYDFYDFYDHQGSETEDVSYLGPDGGILQLCEIAVSPAVGSDAGGTMVSLMLSGHVAPDHTTFFCKFGDVAVEASSARIMETSGVLVLVCNAPPMKDSEDVIVRVSLDGHLYSVNGAPFHYHAKLNLDDVKPSSPRVPLEGGSAIRFTLGDYLFGPGFDPSSVTVPASCYFGEKRVDGEFDAMKSQLTCVAPSRDSPDSVEVRVSLDGQLYTKDAVLVRYGHAPLSKAPVQAPKVRDTL